MLKMFENSTIEYGIKLFAIITFNIMITIFNLLSTGCLIDNNKNVFEMSALIKTHIIQTSRAPYTRDEKNNY